MIWQWSKTGAWPSRLATVASQTLPIHLLQRSLYCKACDFVRPLSFKSNYVADFLPEMQLEGLKTRLSSCGTSFKNMRLWKTQLSCLPSKVRWLFCRESALWDDGFDLWDGGSVVERNWKGIVRWWEDRGLLRQWHGSLYDKFVNSSEAGLLWKWTVRWLSVVGRWFVLLAHLRKTGIYLLEFRWPSESKQIFQPLYAQTTEALKQQMNTTRTQRKTYGMWHIQTRTKKGTHILSKMRQTPTTWR